MSFRLALLSMGWVNNQLSLTVVTSGCGYMDVGVVAAPLFPVIDNFFSPPLRWTVSFVSSLLFIRCGFPCHVHFSTVMTPQS